MSDEVIFQVHRIDCFGKGHCGVVGYIANYVEVFEQLGGTTVLSGDLLSNFSSNSSADLLSEGAALRHGCGGAGLDAGLGGLLLLALPFALPPARSPVGSPDPTARLGRPLERGTRVP